MTYDQGVNNSFYFSEELHSTDESPKSIIVSDRATLFNLLIGLDGYTISSGILSSDLNGTDIVSLPLESDEEMEIGYILLLASRSVRLHSAISNICAHILPDTAASDF